MKWEYKDVRTTGERDKLGEQGWEAYAVTQDIAERGLKVFHLRRSVTKAEGSLPPTKTRKRTDAEKASARRG